MEIKQKFELSRVLVPEMQHSLKILPLSLPDLKTLIDEELLNNPFLEETKPKDSLLPARTSLLNPFKDRQQGKDTDFLLSQANKKLSLREILLKDLGMFANTDTELKIGEEIIGNIDENGYLRISLEEIAETLQVTINEVENVLKIVQQFEPPGIGARTIQECLRIQLDFANEKDPLVRKIVECHLEDIAKKNYSHISKTLNESLERIEACVKKILKLDPKPGRNFSLDEIQHIIPDIIIEEKDEDLEIVINNEDIPSLNINKAYRDILKNGALNPQDKEFLTHKLQSALELLRAISKRQTTLRRIIETVVEIQSEAIRHDLSYLTPLTLTEIAQKLNMHESTICRAIMNKYIKVPYGTVALKDFFSSRLQDRDGQSLSSNFARKLIKELIEQENKKHPLSDQDICDILSKEKNLTISRRTVTKYREELKILSSNFRRER